MSQVSKNELLIVAGVSALLYVFYKGGSKGLAGVAKQAVSHVLANPLQTLQALQGQQAPQQFGHPFGAGDD